MRDFDIKSVGKRMPYSAPDKDFFERVTTETIARAERESKRRITLHRAMITITTVAAAIIAAIVVMTPLSRPTYEEELAQLDLALDAYFEELSDDEIESFATLSDAEIIQYIN